MWGGVVGGMKDQGAGRYLCPSSLHMSYHFLTLKARKARDDETQAAQ